MGITGLLPLLKSIHRPVHLRKFAGQTLGVDAYVWLHRGATACVVQLALGQPTTKYVEYAMNRVRMLIHYGVTPYLVFDGDYLPSKAGTEQERKKRREEGRKAGLELFRLGKMDRAQQELQKAVDITPEMAGMLIQELKKAGIKYVVAPYEADSQLAYLEKHGHIQGIISEDSDLLVFGARCLITKLDQYGNGIMVRRDDFVGCREISLVGWTDVEFRRMAILSGCDYLENIERMGLKTAYRLLRKHKTIERVLQAVRLEGKMKVPSDYLESFLVAELTFLYQWVYCPTQKMLVNLQTPEENVKVDEMVFIGKYVEAQLARGVAMGILHPHTKLPLGSPTNSESIQSPIKQTYSQQENPETKKNMSIENFFKAKRQPLAELNPNSFILTPHQQELARRASTTSWSSPLVNQNLVSENTTPSRVQSLFIPPRRSIDSQQSRVKRPRLCQDEDKILETSTIAAVMTGKSKFFTKPEKRQSERSSKSGDFTVFSDDLIDEALEALPDIPPQILETTSEVLIKTIVSTTEPIENETENLDESQLTLVSDSPSPKSPPVIFDDAEQTFVEEQESTDTIRKPSLCFDAYLLSDIKAVRSESHQERAEVVSSLSYVTVKTCPPSPHLQPQQRLHEVDHTVPLIPASSNPAEPPTSPSCITTSITVCARGSEDYIVPNSEDELSEVESPVRKKSTLNLQSFMFTA